MADLQAPGTVVTRVTFSAAVPEQVLVADYEEQVGPLPANRYNRATVLRKHLRSIMVRRIRNWDGDIEVVVQEPGC